jgi:AcrR family transcriptional regulator
MSSHDVRVAPQRLNGAARAQISEVQRSRMLSAAVDVVSDCGYGGMSVARVTTRAGVSRRTFYDLFDDREDCFLAVFDVAVARATRVAQDAAVEQQTWREQVRAGLSALLQFIGDEPVLSALVIVDALGAGPRVFERRAQGLEKMITVIDRGRSEVKTGAGPPPLTAEGLVGAVLSVIHARVSAGSTGSPVELLNPLMAMIVLPYLGRAAATRELARATPKATHARKPSRDPLEGLGIRFTYRTLRVLAAIASNPGASNREVANFAGIQDQGQISKLLTRLEHHGLIHNTGQGQVKGEANAWTLTLKGAEVERAISIQKG